MTTAPPAPHVLIVGGGLAGLAVAASLVNRGLRLTLLESRPRLGGRASSFQDPATGELVDNCQHVSMACCTNLADFCRRVGIDRMFRREREMVLLDRKGRTSRIRAGRAPAPFHLAGSFLRAHFLSAWEKVQLAYGLARLARSRDERAGEPFESWLVRHRQSPRVIKLFWETVLVSALNERIDQLDVGHARKVFLDGFLRNRDAFQLDLPLVPLGELYGTRLESWLGDQGVIVRLKTGVRTVEYDEDSSTCGVTLRSGESLSGDFVVLAVPFKNVRPLVPEHIRGRIPALHCLDSLRASPITGVHLWFDRAVCPFDHVATPGRLIQWVFNHTAIQGRGVAASESSPGHELTCQRPAPRDLVELPPSIDGSTAWRPSVLPGAGSGDPRPTTPQSKIDSPLGQYLQLVISASYEFLALDNDAIRDAVLAELAEIWPVVKTANLLRSWVVVEHEATFAARPGVDALRPPQQTPIDGLVLAGDWTHTSWPATMEGAVRSGYLAAEVILRTLDRPTRLVRPELKPGFLARWLLGGRESSSSRPTAPLPSNSPPEDADVTPSTPPARVDALERVQSAARATVAPPASRSD
jgi:squalene-associated FAD-dependent desaturase